MLNADNDFPFFQESFRGTKIGALLLVMEHTFIDVFLGVVSV